MEFLKLGVIKDSFGLNGTIKVYSTTTMPDKRYKTGATIYIYNPQTKERIERKVLSYRHANEFDYVKLEGIDTPEQVKEIKSFEIHVIKDHKDLDKDTYFYSDLIGCDVIDKKGNKLGVVKEVEEFPAQLTLRVSRKNNNDFFVPFIKEFIVSVDIKNKAICIEIIEGLL